MYLKSFTNLDLSFFAKLETSKPMIIDLRHRSKID